MSKLKERKEFRTLRGNKNNTGSVLILTPTSDGTVLFQTAKQDGFTQDGKYPKFNYQNKQIFALNDLECAKVVRVIEKEFAFFDVTGDSKKSSIVFHHKASNSPKIINLAFSVYNEKIQCGLQVTDGNDKLKSTSIFINEEEIEILKECLRQQYSSRAIKDGYPSKVVSPDGTFKQMSLPSLTIGSTFNGKQIVGATYDSADDVVVYFLQ
jgi:hypothetical protein